MRNNLFVLCTLALVLQPVQALAAETLEPNYLAMVLFMTFNLLLTIGLFALGIVLVGLFHNHFKPWLTRQRQQRRKEKYSDDPKPHLNPQRRLEELIQQERQDVY